MKQLGLARERAVRIYKRTMQGSVSEFEALSQVSNITTTKLQMLV